MDSSEIKHEFGCDDTLQCCTCLSVGRNLVPLGKYTNIYMKITSDLRNPMIQHIKICWECQSLLKKVLLFQQKVEKAFELLANNQNFIYGPLSTLASITLNDTHHNIIYLNEYIVNQCPSLVKYDQVTTQNCPRDKKTHMNSNNNDSQKNTKLVDESTKNVKDLGDVQLNTYSIPESKGDRQTNIYQTDLYIRKEQGPNIEPIDTPISIQNDNYNMNYGDNNTVTIKIQNNFRNDNVEIDIIDIIEENDHFENIHDFETPNRKETFEVKSESKSKKPQSRWAVKRAAHNKKPKFKIVSTNFDEAFTKLQISNKELTEYMAKERDSELYKMKRFKCEMCVLGFVEEKEWLEHSERHRSHEPLSYTCDICNIKIANKRHLSDHITQHYNVYKCKICQQICRKETRVWHFQHEHKKVFQCLRCDVKCGNRREFFKHYKSWHEKYVCDHCGVCFKMRYCIKDHIRKQHSPFTCPPCNKTFSRYNGMWLHNKLEHSPSAPPAYCVECDTHYKDIYRYKWHLCNSVKHSPKKKVSIPCPDCNKSFTKKVYMKDHYNLVHLKLFRFRCEQCDKNFIRNAELVKHRRRKHEGILPPRNKICYLCGRGFTTNKILRNHIRTHETHENNADDGQKSAKL